MCKYCLKKSSPFSTEFLRADCTGARTRRGPLESGERATILHGSPVDACRVPVTFRRPALSTVSMFAHTLASLVKEYLSHPANKQLLRIC